MAASQFRIVVLLAGAGFVLSGCGSNLSRTFGLTRDAPDEFTVTTRAPLSMPPDFSLRPPRPGAERPQEMATSRQAEEALVPESAMASQQPAGGVTPGQQALVQAAGPAAPGNVRSQVDEAALDAPKPGFVDELLFWRSPTPPGTVIDPEKESQRLRENAALGQGPEVGDTPIIQPRKKGWLEGIL
jgi:hypothetical protein